MARTFVLAFKKSDDADAAIGEYKTAGFKVAKVGPTDQLELKKEAEPSIIWRSGADADWIVIIASKDGISVDS